MSLYEDGLVLDQEARRYMNKNPGVDYQTACNAVIKKVNAEHAARKAAAMKAYDSDHGNEPKGLGWRIYRDNKSNVVEAEMEGTGKNINRLSDLVIGLRRFADDSIDAKLAVRVVNSDYASVARGAAGDFLSAAAKQLTNDRNLTSAQSATDRPHHATFTDALKEVAGTYPEVLAVYNGGMMSETALRTILWPVFKTPAAQYGSRTVEKSYEALKTYEFVAAKKQ